MKGLLRRVVSVIIMFVFVLVVVCVNISSYLLL